MALSRCYRLPFTDWPAEDRRLWEQETAPVTDLFDDAGPLARRSPRELKRLKSNYSAFLGFVATDYPHLLGSPPGVRVDWKIAAEFAKARLHQWSGRTVWKCLADVQLILTAFCEEKDWSWLRKIANRVKAKSRPDPKPYVTSLTLYLLGFKLMDRADAEAAQKGAMNLRHAKMYRDGLIVALMASVPLRRGTFAKLRIGKQLVRTNGSWTLNIPAEDTKTKVPLDYLIPTEVSARIDIFLSEYRHRFKGTETHESPWPSQQGRPMSGPSLYDAIRRRTTDEFGFSVNPHRFRHAAATFWSERDPQTVRGSKNLLGHASFEMTEKFYIMAESRIGAEVLARAIDRRRASCRPELQRKPVRVGRKPIGQIAVQNPT